MVHFFLYDYKFERVWSKPEADLAKLKQYRAVLTPDFSMYTDMAPALQLYNTFRNRWCGAFYASKGLRVIPTVNWGNENTFEFCFEGIEKGSVVAVSTYMASEHGNHKDQKDFFLKGYQEMLRRVEPEKIICYHTPFPEMEGNLVYVDYELSSWRYMHADQASVPSKAAKKEYIVIKSGYVVHETKGSGNSHGGEWRPKKADDERFLGKPNEKKKTRRENKNGGYDRETIMDQEGKARVERHYSDHGKPQTHSNPHDHDIDWSRGYPYLEPPRNYPDGKAPELKYHEVIKMADNDSKYAPEDNRFQSISEFKWCITYGGEVEFVFHDKIFGVFSKLRKTPDSKPQILISQVWIEHPEETEMWCDSADEVLEYRIDGVRLRDIITEVEVSDRTI